MKASEVEDEKTFFQVNWGCDWKKVFEILIAEVKLEIFFEDLRNYSKITVALKEKIKSSLCLHLNSAPLTY